MDSTESSATITQKHLMVAEEKRTKWFAMRERIAELVRNVDISNVREIAKEISKEDLLECRGLFCQEIMRSQMSSPQLTDVYAALVAIINSDFPDVGLLLVKRVVLELKDEYKYDGRSNTRRLRLLSKFLAHLVNQLVVWATLAWDVCLLLMGNPNSDNVEVAVKFCIECGSTFQEFLPDRFGTVLGEFGRVSQEGEMIGRSVRFLISMLFKIQGGRFRDYPGMIDELNVVHITDQQIHQVSMLHVLDPESSADDFEHNPYDFCDVDYSSEDDEVSSWKP